MKCINDYRLNLGDKEVLPLMIGGMGVDISADKLALSAARCGAVGHISDAMVPTVTDRHLKTKYTKEKFTKYSFNKKSFDKTIVKFDTERIREATLQYVSKTMSDKKGDGLIFVNCMEKLTMNNPRETLQCRLEAAMTAGIDGITLSAGLHLQSFELMEKHPRFHDCKLGIIVSSVRALNIFLKKIAKTQRLPDYIIVEGPLAGGHLGFGMDWFRYDLETIVDEVMEFCSKNNLQHIPIIPAGGIFTGSEGAYYLEKGAAAIQVATRFTISQECGLPDKVKQQYANAQEEDVYVAQVSPTGYPMRILKTSPALNSGIRPNCEMYGYLLDKNGRCAYVDAYQKAVAINEKNPIVKDKVCLCTHMRDYKLWTCGHFTYRLKDTTNQLPDGSNQLPTAEHILSDYLYSKNYEIRKPSLQIQKEVA